MYLTEPFPECISFGAVRAPVFLTQITETTSGQEQRNRNWTRVRHRFDVSFAVRTASDYVLLAMHFMQANGRFNTFGIKDFLDFTVNEADGVVIEEEDGSLQLYKRYGSGPVAYLRKITKPDAGGQLFDNGSPAVGLSIELGTGKVLGGSSATDAAELSWSGTFLVPARYDIDELPSQVVNRGDGGELLVSVTSIPVIEVKE